MVGEREVLGREELFGGEGLRGRVFVVACEELRASEMAGRAA